MPQLAKDSNHSTLPVREGDPLGGVFTPGTGIALDTWLRLMPSGNATKVADNPNQLNIGAVRADIRGSNLMDWYVYILNEGYEQERRVKKYDLTSRIVTTVPDGQLGFDKLPDALVFMVAPRLINPFTLLNRASGANTVEIGYSPTNRTNNVLELTELEVGKAITIPATNIHKLFYRYAAIAAADALEWGEHYTYTP